MFAMAKCKFGNPRCTGGCRECYEAKQRRKDSHVAGEVVAAALGIAQALTVTGASDLQPGQGGTFDQNWAESSLQSEAGRQSNEIEQGTRSRGNRTRGRSQRR